MPLSTPTSFDDYFSGFPTEHQAVMQLLRETIRVAAPDAVESISYKMPAYDYYGKLVWLCAHTKHIGFYPRVSAIVAFQEALKRYKTSKGAVQFPVNEALPVDLITRMVQFRVKENRERALKG
jgi:uncharacterized protein YdhG (YjbR/CyaY superfamily)